MVAFSASSLNEYSVANERVNVNLAALEESGIPLWVQDVIVNKLGPNEYLAVTDMDVDTYFSLIDEGYIDVFKPVGAETQGKGPGGMRVVKVDYPSG